MPPNVVRGKQELVNSETLSCHLRPLLIENVQAEKTDKGKKKKNKKFQTKESSTAQQPVIGTEIS